jgi:hypothetical protein
MRPLLQIVLAASAVSACASALVLVACSDSTGSSGPVDEAGILNSTERPPGTTCEKDAGDEGGHTYSSGVCAQSVAIPGCRMCLSGTTDGSDESVCVNACNVGSSGCPAGQTCEPQPSNGSRSSSNCSTSSAGADAVGYCR